MNQEEYSIGLVDVIRDTLRLCSCYSSYYSKSKRMNSDEINDLTARLQIYFENVEPELVTGTFETSKIARILLENLDLSRTPPVSEYFDFFKRQLPIAWTQRKTKPKREDEPPDDKYKPPDLKMI